jgi:heme/copper-type cytochrome/quinol oxidase subunit 2
MLAEVKVVSPEEYQAWYDAQAQRIKDARAAQAKARPKYDSGGIAPTDNADTDQVNSR